MAAGMLSVKLSVNPNFLYYEAQEFRINQIEDE